MEFYYVQNTRTNKTIVYSSGISSEDYSISPSLYKNLVVKDSEILVQSVTEVYNNNGIDKSAIQQLFPILKLKIRKFRYFR
jgi:hypothetical protein